MQITQAFLLMRDRLDSNFTTIPITHGNDDFDPAANGQNGWVFTKIGLLAEGSVSIGAPGEVLHRDVGEFHVWVYVPRGAQVGTAESYAEQIRDLFKSDAIPGIVIRSRSIRDGMADGTVGADGRWWGIPIVIQFQYDRIE
jgi:hypothetical protein